MRAFKRCSLSLGPSLGDSVLRGRWNCSCLYQVQKQIYSSCCIKWVCWWWWCTLCTALSTSIPSSTPKSCWVSLLLRKQPEWGQHPAFHKWGEEKQMSLCPRLCFEDGLWASRTCWVASGHGFCPVPSSSLAAGSHAGTAGVLQEGWDGARSHTPLPLWPPSTVAVSCWALIVPLAPRDSSFLLPLCQPKKMGGCVDKIDELSTNNKKYGQPSVFTLPCSC